VNAIPTEVSMDVDMRSESPDALNKLVAEFQAIVREAVKEENAARSTNEGKIEDDVKLIGDRPSGQRTDRHEHFGVGLGFANTPD